MMFSVLLSVYHKENPEYLKLSLDSILNQTVSPSEIILVKDGPLTEELEKTIAIYLNKTSTLKVVPLDKNQGLGKALNEGLKHCSHKLIARMDTDDIAKPNRFEEQLKVFDRIPNLDICSSWIEEFENTTDNVITIKKLPEKHIDIAKYAKHRCPINHPAAMYKKEAVIKVGGYSGFPEDYCLWIKMLKNGSQFYNIPKSLLYFRFSREVIKRRGGWSYAKEDIKTQTYFFKIGYINLLTYIYNLIIRITVRIIPSNIRTIVYQKGLR